MRRSLLLSLPALLLALTGCPGKPKNGECKTSEDCLAQEGYGKICIQGRCQECGQDSDCRAGFVCRDMKCVPKPQCERDSDCPGGGSCQNGRCVAMAPKAECDADADCGPGRACEGGKCVARAGAVMGCPADGRYQMVNFGFDESTLTEEARGILEKDAECIKRQNPRRITIAGNCDERGTADYNISLGQRRAESVRKYLVNLGISANTLRTVSYGKERSLCTESSEQCWARNRRAELSAE